MPTGVRRVLERVLHQVHEHALDLVGVDPDRGRLVRAERPRRVFPRRRARRAPGRRGRRRSTHPGRAAAAPACSRERSSRFPTSRLSRSASARIVPESWLRSSRPSSRSSRASALAEVRIAISGVRRSWLTARRTAVFIASLRRSASASSASRASRSRSIAIPSSDASAGQEMPSARGASRPGAARGRSCPPVGRPPRAGSCRHPRADSAPSSIRALSTWSARAASSAMRSSSLRTCSRSSSEAAISARRADSCALRRARAARTLTTTAVKR